MPVALIAAGIGAAGAVGGALISSSGAKSAANAQVEAANTAAAQQKAMYEQQVALQEPFRQAGLTAQDRYMQLLGLSNPAATGATAASTNPQDYGLSVINMPDDTGMGYGNGGIQYVDSQGNPVSDVNAYMAQHPQASTAAAAPSDFGKYAKDFSMADYTADPGYQFRLDQGQQALERSAAARGLLSSGSTLKGIENYAQGAASQEYQNAFNRYQINRSNQLNPLQSLMGAGQSSTNTLTSAAANQGTNQANTTMAAGQARASGYVGSANALSGALGTIGNFAANYPSMNAMNNYYNNYNNPYGVPSYGTPSGNPSTGITVYNPQGGQYVSN